MRERESSVRPLGGPEKKYSRPSSTLSLLYARSDVSHSGVEAAPTFVLRPHCPELPSPPLHNERNTLSPHVYADE